MEGCCDNMKMVSSRTPQGGLGQIDPMTFAAQEGGDVLGSIMDFIGGLFHKDPNKVEYDRVRQQAFDSMVTIQTQVDNAIGSQTLTRTMLQKYIDAMTSLMAGFKSYTDRMLTIVDQSWIDPRFHDFYDVMRGMRDSWQAMLATLPADYFGGIFDYFNGGGETYIPESPFGDPNAGIQPKPPMSTTIMSNMPMLLIGGVVLGYFLMGRKRG